MVKPSLFLEGQSKLRQLPWFFNCLIPFFNIFCGACSSRHAWMTVGIIQSKWIRKKILSMSASCQKIIFFLFAYLSCKMKLIVEHIYLLGAICRIIYSAGLKKVENTGKVKWRHGQHRMACLVGDFRPMSSCAMSFSIA